MNSNTTIETLENDRTIQFEEDRLETIAVSANDDNNLATGETTNDEVLQMSKGIADSVKRKAEHAIIVFKAIIQLAFSNIKMRALNESVESLIRSQAAFVVEVARTSSAFTKYIIWFVPFHKIVNHLRPTLYKTERPSTSTNQPNSEVGFWNFSYKSVQDQRNEVITLLSQIEIDTPYYDEDLYKPTMPEPIEVVRKHFWADPKHLYAEKYPDDCTVKLGNKKFYCNLGLLQQHARYFGACEPFSVIKLKLSTDFQPAFIALYVWMRSGSFDVPPEMIDRVHYVAVILGCKGLLFDGPLRMHHNIFIYQIPNVAYEGPDMAWLHHVVTETSNSDNICYYCSN